MVFQEVLTKHASREAGGVVVGGCKTVNLFVEGNARVRRAVGDMDAEVWSALEEIKKEEVDASGSGLAGADVRF